LVESRPDIYLDEIAEELLQQHEVSVSLSTIQRSLKLLGFTRKKVFSMLSMLSTEKLSHMHTAFKGCS
jgi:hypothetical protein